MDRPKRSGWLILGIVAVLIAAGLGVHVVWWDLALGRGAERLHRAAERVLARSEHAHFLSEFRYPDTFILRVEAELERRLTPAELDGLLDVGSVKTEEKTARGVDVTWDFHAYGIRIYTVKAGYGADGERVSFMTSSRAVRWHPRDVP